MLSMDEQQSIKSEFAIASLVMGIVSFIQIFNIEKPLVAVIFGILALKKIKIKPQLQGKNLAIAGIILGIISIVATTILTIKFLPQLQQMMQNMQMQK